MTITFYTTASPVNKITKSLSTGVSVTGTLRNSTEIESPTIIGLDISTIPAADRSNVINANYVYIAEFNRYYFITNQHKRSDKLIDFDLQVDVLYTYATQILNQNCLIERSQFYGSQYINDSLKPVYNFPMVLTKAFSSGFDSFHYYLTVASSVEGS